MATESGYSNQKKLGISQFKSVHSLGSGAHGTRNQMGVVYEKLPAAALVAVTPIIDGGIVKFLEIELTGHTAIVGDIMQMTTGTLVNWKFEIVQIIDVDKFYVLPIAPSFPLVGEDAEILGHQILRTGPSGSLVVDPSGIATAAKQDEQTALLTQIEANQDYTAIDFAVLDFSSTNVDNLAYVELIADIGGTAGRKVQIFMASGEPLFLAFGAAASEVDQIVIIPGGNGVIDLVIPANERLSVKAVNAVTVNSGSLIINVWG